MKKTLNLLQKKTKLLKFIIIGIFTCLFMCTVLWITLAISNSFNVEFIFFPLSIGGWLMREYIVSQIKNCIKAIFPTTYFPEKIGKMLNNFLSFGVTLFLLGVGINPIALLLRLQSINDLKLNLLCYALCLWAFLTYAIGVLIGSAYYYYKSEFQKLKKTT